MNKLKLLLISFLLFFAVSVVYSNDLPKRPNPPVLVNDLINFLEVNDKNYIESKLRAYNDSTSTQIVIVITDDLLGYDKAEYAYQIGETWGVGQKGKDNGLVILVKPTGTQGERGVFIATGYGLESVLTDALCKRIIEQEMIPMFKQNNIAGGINQSIDVVMGLLSGSFTAEEYQKKGNFSFYFIIPFLLIILILKLISTKSAHIANKGAIPFWTLFFLANSMSNRHSGSYQDFRSGGGGFGGGGFGGFGGGGFGGGGAGGSW